MDDCGRLEPLLARMADGSVLDAGERQALEAHLTGCVNCGIRLAEQRDVAAMLRARTPGPVSPLLRSRISAAIDGRTGEGFLDLVNWRAWTAGLAPIAAALALAAYLGFGTTGGGGTAAADTTQASFDTWVLNGTAGTPASVFLQPAAEADALIETVLTGAPPAATGGSDVR
jgi:hypothetical protein